MIVVGIDPGLTGAIAAFDMATRSGAVWDIPTLSTTGKSRVRRVVDPREVADIFDAIIERDKEIEFVMESVSSMPGQGVASVFSLGDTFGSLRGVIGALGYECVCVVPQKWKHALGLTSDKDESLAMARDLFPSMEDFARKKDHNRAEAMLIAVWRANELEG
jgi:crossover junction endodeoxyribonuclease RuvC